MNLTEKIADKIPVKNDNINFLNKVVQMIYYSNIIYIFES